MSDQEANSVKEVVKEFEADNAIKTVFSKVDPLVLVVRLIFDEKAKREHLYLEIILKPEQDTQQIRESN